jgi:phosphate/sulfate permease
MSLSLTEAYMIIGFALSAYAIVANDSIQTLGTFIASNKERPWWQLWLFASSILVAVLLYSWFVYGGDPSYGRLERFPYDPSVYGLIHIIPPIVLLVLTRYGMPVSTTFLILTFFAPKNLEQMVIKSLLGYGLAFGCAMLVFWGVHKLMISVEGDEESHAGEPLEQREHHTPLWLVLQLLSTAFLWSQWLIQDLANLFIYFPHSPEPLPVSWLALSLVLMVGMQGLIFKAGGGEIQEIVNQKSGARDVREATIINLVYGGVILYFKEYSNMPMSTTWVFLGLLAGRELSYKLVEGARLNATWRMIMMDLGKATLGLVVSVVLALGLPYLLR